MAELLKNKIREELTKDDVKKEVVKTLDSKELEDKILKIVKQSLKNNKELEDKAIEISKNVLTQLFKALWLKRNFWQSSLKNKST